MRLCRCFRCLVIGADRRLVPQASHCFGATCPQDDQKAEDDMALRRAALLEKRLRREKETQLRRQQLEAEMECRKEEARWARPGTGSGGGLAE